MSDEKLEKDWKVEWAEFVDCGAASQVTRGVPVSLLFELGHPPWNKQFLF